MELADEIDKKCSGDLKALILAKLGKGVEKNFSRSILSLYKCFMKLNFAESGKCRATIRHVSGDVVSFGKVTKTVYNEQTSKRARISATLLPIFCLLFETFSS